MPTWIALIIGGLAGGIIAALVTYFIMKPRVEETLAAAEKAGDFLESPVLEDAATLESTTITEGPGTVIGRYKLLQEIGEGGFGVVWMNR